MKKLCFLIFALFFSILQSQAVYALDIPRLTGYVNDYAGMMSQDEKDRIARDLELYEKSTSTQIFILTIPSLEGMPIEDFSIKVAESWKAGQKGKDNGIIITIAKADGKIRIEVGRGLEGSVTDLVSGRIIREEMSPKLKAGNTAEALETAVAKIKLAAKGEYKGDETKKNTSSDGEWLMPLLGYVFILFIAGVVGIAIELLGGIVGGAGFYYFSSWVFNPTTLTLIIIAIVGFFLGILAKKIFEGISDGEFVFFGDGGGGGDSGGFFGGGGGDFGGGGASGSFFDGGGCDCGGGGD